jgi:hypothetical protein
MDFGGALGGFEDDSENFGARNSVLESSTGLGDAFFGVGSVAFLGTSSLSSTALGWNGRELDVF